jgi:GNAT superfamily N-acetyltransferase
MAPDFPPGLTTRGATLADAAAVTDLVRAAEVVDHGEAELTFDDLESGWRRPGFDLSLDVVLVYDRAHLMAYAEVPSWRTDATVLPQARGRGIGTALLAWLEHRALERTPPGEEARVGQTVIDTNTAAAELFLRHGYAPRHTSWALRLPRHVTIEHPPLPTGIMLRPYRPAVEEEAVYRVIEDAFNEWPNRTASSFEEWAAFTTERNDFDPSLLLVATAADEVVGAAFGLPYPEEGWVQQLAVRADHRGRGIAKALLREAFEEFRRRGFPEVGLSTDSRTGALDLYLSVGMVVRSSYTHYSKLLRAAAA